MNVNKLVETSSAGEQAKLQKVSLPSISDIFIDLPAAMPVYPPPEQRNYYLGRNNQLPSMISSPGSRESLLPPHINQPPVSIAQRTIQPIAGSTTLLATYHHPIASSVASTTMLNRYQHQHQHPHQPHPQSHSLPTGYGIPSGINGMVMPKMPPIVAPLAPAPAPVSVSAPRDTGSPISNPHSISNNVHQDSIAANESTASSPSSSPTSNHSTFPKRKTRNNLPKETTYTLLKWLNEHLNHPYPNSFEKNQLMHLTGLNQQQLSNWFINARRRKIKLLKQKESV